MRIFSSPRVPVLNVMIPESSANSAPLFEFIIILSMIINLKVKLILKVLIKIL